MSPVRSTKVFFLLTVWLQSGFAEELHTCAGNDATKCSTGAQYEESSMLQKMQVERHVQSDGAATRPGAKLWLSQASFDYLSHKMLPLVLDSLKRIKIPAFSGKEDVGPMTFDYKIDNFNIASVGIQSPHILLSDAGMMLSFNGVTFHGSADYDVQADNYFQVPYSSGSATIDVTSGTYISAFATLGVANGKPTVKVSQVQANAQGGATIAGSMLSSVINVVTEVFNDQIMSTISDLIVDQFSSFADKTLECIILQKLNLVFPIPLPAPLDRTAIDLSFIELSTNSNFATAAVKGSFVDLTGGVQTPLCEGLQCNAPAEMSKAPPSTLATSMLGASLSDYTVESALKIYQAQGALNITLTQADMPKDCPTKLTTYGFSTLLIGGFKLPAMCDAPRRNFGMTPGNCNMSLSVGVMEGISASMTNGYIEANLPILFSFSVVSHKTGERKFAFSFSSDSKAKGSVYVRNGTELVLKAKSVTLDLKNEQSVVPAPPVGLFNGLIDFVLNWVMVPIANKVLATGFPLNLDMSLFNISASDAWVNVSQDITTISSNLAVDIDFAPILGMVLEPSDDDAGCR